MTNRPTLLFLIFISLSFQMHAETLNEYVATCQKELGFNRVPTLHCDTDGVAFAATGPLGTLNDHIGHRVLSTYVDLTFACRWVRVSDQQPAFTLELMIHNRQSGKTCFFSAKEQDFTVGTRTFKDKVPLQITSITSANASSYWRSPYEVDRDVQCVGCHVAGPYIASPAVAEKMAMYGLMNDGHDTVVSKSTSAAKKYRAVGETFKHWNTIIESNIARETCAGSCHAIGEKSTVSGIVDSSSFILLPSISAIISRTARVGSMPPVDPLSDYRWINRDTPLNGSGDHESLSAIKNDFNHFYCKSPKRIQARAVGSEYIFETGKLPDTLKKFNLRDGLVCENSDQENGTCSNYETRYLCDGEWTVWGDTDTNLNDYGDSETRANYKSKYGLCNSPIEIQARVRGYNSIGQLFTKASSYGPRDRLSTFSKEKGLACINSDQGANQTCSNYMIRLLCE